MLHNQERNLKTRIAVDLESKEHHIINLQHAANKPHIHRYRYHVQFQIIGSATESRPKKNTQNKNSRGLESKQHYIIN